MVRPDFSKAQHCAYDTVATSNQKKLPLSIKQLISRFPNLHLQKYTVFAKKRGLSMEETFDVLDSEEGCLWKRSDNTYVILYNDTVANTGRVRFTLAHELGHFILKHHEKTNKTILSRYSLSDEAYDVFEKEANYFAKRLLAPLPLIDLYIANWNEVNAHIIEWAFDVSHTVSHYLVRELNKRQRNTRLNRVGHPMVANFIDFINSDTRSQICLNCRSMQIKANKHCFTCGKNTFIASTPKNYPYFYSERKLIMQYSKIETNEAGIPLICPQCASEELTEEFTFCPWCTAFIHNVCLGTENKRYYVDNQTQQTVEVSLLDQSNAGCRKILDGGYRYCPDCRSETSFYRQKFLEDWQTEKEKNENPFPEKRFKKQSL